MLSLGHEQKAVKNKTDFCLKKWAEEIETASKGMETSAVRLYTSLGLVCTAPKTVLFRGARSYFWKSSKQD